MPEASALGPAPGKVCHSEYLSAGKRATTRCRPLALRTARFSCPDSNAGRSGGASKESAVEWLTRTSLPGSPCLSRKPRARDREGDGRKRDEELDRAVENSFNSH